MSTTRYGESLRERWDAGCYICVGLDSTITGVPQVLSYAAPAQRQLLFNKAIIDATFDEACAYKLNLGFYIEHEEGILALVETVKAIHHRAPGMLVILDGKFGDIGNTSASYARFAFDVVDADAVTVSPYVGYDGIAPFIERSDRGVFVLSRTSNPGAKEFQALETGSEGKVPLYSAVASAVANSWNSHGNCGLVVGATAIAELRAVRDVAPDLPILVPGVGAQGGDLVSSVQVGRDAHGGVIVNVSRAIIFASDGPDFDMAARQALGDMNRAVRDAI
jgi:orotidine-5'-phosphate decarboxylase